MISSLSSTLIASPTALPAGRQAKAGAKQSPNRRSPRPLKNGGLAMTVMLFLFLPSFFSYADDFTLTSPAFNYNGAIPSKYTCDEKNVSPPLRWKGTPKSTQTLVLIVEDPDAPRGIWVHWVLYNLPPVISSLPEAMPDLPILMNGEKNGTNDFKTLGYGGPCPPSGNHRYFFKLYALDFAPDLKPGLTKKELLQKIKDHVLAEAELVGTYQR